MNASPITPCSVELRREAELGSTQSSGLSGRHHFSFAAYQRADRHDWGGLRALSFYRLESGAVREPSFHAGFEIVTMVTGGSLRRTGTFAPIQPLRVGAAELVSAGTGVNLGLATTGDGPATYIEIWVRSEAATRRRARRQCLPNCPIGSQRPVASSLATASRALKWRAAACLHRIMLASGETLNRAVEEDACAYVVILVGEVAGNSVRARKGDALAVGGPGMLALRAERPSEILFVEILDQ